MRVRRLSWMAALVVAVAACSAPVSTAEPSAITSAPSPSRAPSTPSTTGVPTTTAPPTTVAPTTTTLAPGSCGLTERAVDAVPDRLRERLWFALADPVWAGVDASISIWIDGYGEVVAIDPDTPLLPASNQKLFTAMGAHLLLDPDHRFTTEVRLDGDDLVLVAGGDPTLTSRGPHSLAALAGQVLAAGVTEVGTLSVDVSHFEQATMAEGWQDWQIPDYVGPLSALTVDDNRHRRDPDYVRDPAAENLELFRRALADVGVSAPAGTVRTAPAPSAPVVASVASAPVSDLLVAVLTGSDNETAEAIVREIGGGSTADGIARIDAALSEACPGLTGVSGDGSGLSRADFRSAREWQTLLRHASSAAWGPDLRAALPVAGRTGTLAGRLGGAGVAGNVAAKTGSIIGGKALSGYATTADGRAVVFSIVVNGDPAAASATVGAIDALVAAAVSG